MVIFDVASGTVTLDQRHRARVEQINSTECGKRGDTIWPRSIHVEADVCNTQKEGNRGHLQEIYIVSRDAYKAMSLLGYLHIIPDITCV